MQEDDRAAFNAKYAEQCRGIMEIPGVFRDVEPYFLQVEVVHLDNDDGIDAYTANKIAEAVHALLPEGKRVVVRGRDFPACFLKQRPAQ